MDAVLTLIEYGTPTYDEYGNEVLTETRHDVFCKVRSTWHSEYYDAAQVGLHPSLTFIISHRVDYHGEQEVEYGGKRYDVIRTDWDDTSDSISLVVEEKVHDAT